MPACSIAPRSRSWNEDDKRGQRQADAALDHAHLLQHPLDRDRIGLDEQVAMQSEQLVVQRTRLGKSPANAAAHISCIRRGATLAVTEITPSPPISSSGNVGAVVAAVDRKSLRRAANQIGTALEVRGGILDADDVGHLREAHHRVVLHVAHRASRHVVQDRGDVDRLGDRLEMPVQPFLGRLVVVRHDGQAQIGARPSWRRPAARSPRAWSWRRCRRSPVPCRRHAERCLR